MLKSLILALPLTLLAAANAGAHGALALGGSTADVGRNGIAIGMSKDQDTVAQAEATALEQCRAFQSSNPQQTTALCKVVSDFDHEWAVVMMDPKPLTPGFGWSIDPDKATAERNAMNQCKASSRADRQQFCAVAGELQDSKP